MKAILTRGEAGFDAELERLVSRDVDDTASAEGAVREILARVRAEGDAAVLELTARFDRVELTAADLRIPEAALERAWHAISDADRSALELSAQRIRAFHARQLDRTWLVEEADGVVLGQRVTPLDSVGLYVPGGKASYPSSVLMNAIPARVAGVRRIAMVCPTPDGETNPHVLAAAWLAGVREVYRVGGAQAVAALAYGTASIPAVDKIVGPGNIYVATAKRLVFGTVDIDMVAGPSEILVVSDGSGLPAHVAADLLSQAEHDEMATVVLVTTERGFAAAVVDEVEQQLARLPRQD
ncbi:MAG TPA: histidinol dehydrogenase, partial [Deferrisomatales bacterium]|nr:histidinol dehydrogenase [Deferrisomatales bacterium]